MEKRLLTLLRILLTAPIIAFLIWVERQASLPWITNRMGWPWVFLDSSFEAQTLMNVSLLGALLAFLIFATKKRVQKAILLFGLGSITLTIIASWQPSGIIVWSWINHAIFAQLTSFSAFWALGFSGWLIYRNPQSLAYSKNRDLLFFAAALVVTPWLSFDRLLMIAAYVTWASFEIHRRKRST